MRPFPIPPIERLSRMRDKVGRLPLPGCSPPRWSTLLSTLPVPGCPPRHRWVANRTVGTTNMGGRRMRIESSVTSVSWIPSEAVTGAVLKGTFESGFTHYDDPPPDELDDLEELRADGKFRFANHLAAWVEIDDGRIVDAGYAGGGMMGATTVRLANLRTTFEPVP